MTFGEIINCVDDYKDNGFHERTKLRWLTELDGKVAADVMLMGIEEIRELPHTYPEAKQCKPLVGYPHEDIYTLWLEAKIDYANGEYGKYQNTMEMFNEAYGNFKRWFASVYQPAQGKQVVGYGGRSCHPVYYMTAYGLAVMKGYSGTLDEWLESLKIKGDPGKSAYQYAIEGGYTGTEEAFADHMAGNGKTAYQYAVEGGYTGSVSEFRAKMAMEYASLNHDHKDTYSPLKHDHAGEYAVKNHDHGEQYAPANHDHGTAYAPLGHSHTFCIEEKVTLFADSWKEDNTMAIVIATIPSTAKVIIVSPDTGNENYAAYMDCGVRCVSQGSDGLTFRCEDAPDIDLVVNLVGFV